VERVAGQESARARDAEMTDRDLHPASRIDRWEQTIEAALEPGRFISWNAGGSFLEKLESVEGQIADLIRTAPAQAVMLYETFIAGCYEKADELDDSSGNFGMFVETIFSGWVKARQAAEADPVETARRILDWMDDDPYGFCSDLEQELVKVLDKSGLAAFERVVRERFEHSVATGSQRNKSGEDLSYARQRWAEILRTVLAGQGHVEAYIELCHQTKLTAEDCLAIANIFQARQRPDVALDWVGRGLKLDKRNTPSSSKYDLSKLKRELLQKLGRGDEALEAAWTEFRENPAKYSYEELMRYVPQEERAAWHAKAMEAATEADLHSVIELWLQTHEFDRLVGRLRKAPDKEIEDLSHYTTEPAAKQLSKDHPDVAAKVYRALGLRILKDKKSKYYEIALEHCENAKHCYERAGLITKWDELVHHVRAEHHRKSGFMPGFDDLVAGAGPSMKPSFLNRAKARWSTRQLESP